MSVVCRCDLARCVGFDPDEEDRCPACPWPLKVHLLASLRRRLAARRPEPVAVDVPVARQITRRIRGVAKTLPTPDERLAAYGLADLIAAEFDPGHLAGRPPWEQPR